MNVEQLKEFKEQAKKFYLVLENMVNYFDTGSKGTAIKVICQNIAFNGIGARGYSHIEAVNKVERGIKLLKQLKEYNSNDWIVDFAHNELSMFHYGITYEEERDENV